MSDHQGIQDQDPAERLAAALRRIAVSVERREASAAADRRALESARETAHGTPAGPAEAPAVAASLDALIARLRAVLDNPGGS